MDERHDPANWPRWAFLASALLVAALVTMMTVVAQRPAVIGPLAAIVVVPWVDHVLGKHPPVWMFLTLSLAPLLAINTVAFEAAGTDAATVSAMIAVFVQGESVSAYSPKRALAGVLLGGAVLAAHATHADGLDAIYWIAGSGIAVTVGYLIRKQQETVLELRETQAQLVGEATLRERQRIAREVHDVIAHSMTVTMMHMTAARMAVRRDPQAAIDTLEEAERLGRSSLTEIRRTVGLLRADVDRPTDPALPTVADISSLVADYRAAGVDVELDVAGPLDRLDGSEGLAVYRLVQEAVANAAKHAPGAPVHAEIDVADEVVVRVTNPVPAGHGRRRGGNGLAGMRERAQLLGGRVSAGPDGDRWTVEFTLPGPRVRGACR